MKKLILLSILPLGLLAQTNNYTVKGKIGHLNAPAKVYLRFYINNSIIKVDSSATLKDGNFVINGHIDGAREAYFLIDYTGKGVNEYGMTPNRSILYVEPGTMNVSSKDSLNHIVITGSPINAESKQFVALTAAQSNVFRTNIAMGRKLDREHSTDTALMNKLDAEMDVANKEREAIIHKYITEHPDSYFSLVGIMQIDDFANPATSLPWFNKLSPRIQNTAMGKEFKGTLDKSTKVSAEHMAPDFTEADTTGKPVSLSSFRGKYVLLDFWASWCGPCRAETPNVLKQYNKFKDKNFTVLSVALDDDKRSWERAIQQDGMTWTNISALKLFNAPSAKLYNILAIPQNVLIDPSGKIIGRNLKGKDLEDKLTEIFKN